MKTVYEIYYIVYSGNNSDPIKTEVITHTIDNDYDSALDLLGRLNLKSKKEYRMRTIN